MSCGQAALRRRICFVAAAPMSLRVFMAPHVRRLATSHEITLVANGTAEDLAPLVGPSISFARVRIERRISPWRDLAALMHLWQLFRRERFDCVHSITPKAGLLAMTAARLARVPMRVHTFTGQVWATRHGASRLLLKTLDAVLARNATSLLTDSHSQREFLVATGVVDESRIDVLADGSFAGVDTDRFRLDVAVRHRIRGEHAVPDDAVLFMFLSRLGPDKGLVELARAFSSAAARNSSLQIMIVGPDEGGFDPLFASVAQRFPGRVHRVGHVDRPEDFLCAADVLCLPSHREGFGSVLLEAASIGIPVLASRIYGITDAVDDGRTGILHTVGADAEIADAMLRLSSNPELRSHMGRAGRERVVERFSEDRLTTAFAEYYRKLFRDEPIVVAPSRAGEGGPMKRLLDVALSLAALALLWPVLLVLAAVIRVTMGGPVLFRQVRPGLNGRLFTMYKFRTMREGTDANGRALPDAQRITRLGHFLRRTSLDELPELWNVLRGDMSLVGPRPLLQEYLPLYSPTQARRHEVRPGITGWAQVNGRNAISWDEKLALDVWYVDHHTMITDLKILLMTITRVIRGEGIAQEGHATAEPFRGSCTEAP